MVFYIIIRGALGCGKTTIAKKIADEINAKYISIDTILKKNNLTKEREAGFISQRSFIKANEIIASKAKQILDSHISVIFDGNFYWKSQIDDLIKRLKVFPGYVFTLKAPLEVCIKRDRKRKKPYGEGAVRAVYNKSTEFNYGIIIDATPPLNKCVKDILSYLPSL